MIPFSHPTYNILGGSLVQLKILPFCDLLDSELNREKLGITAGSVSFGQEHSKDFFNRLISALFLGSQPGDTEERERLACLKMLERIAIVRIELANYDVIHIHRELRETTTSFFAKIGKSLVKS